MRCIILAVPGRAPRALFVEVPPTAAAFAQGYAGRARDRAGDGMLFAFDPPRVVSFWMRGVLFPLDLAFFDALGRLQTLATNARPGDAAPIASRVPIRWVLEMPSDAAAGIGITAGTILRP